MGISTGARGQARQWRRIQGEILRGVALAGTAQSLSPRELGLGEEPVTRAALALPVWAWVRYGETPIRVEAEVVAWTEHAGAVRWLVPGLGVHKAWVWSGAIEPRPPE